MADKLSFCAVAQILRRGDQLYPDLLKFCSVDLASNAVALVEYKDHIEIFAAADPEATERVQYAALLLAFDKWPDGVELLGQPTRLSDDRKALMRLAIDMGIELNTPHRLGREYMDALLANAERASVAANTAEAAPNRTAAAIMGPPRSDRAPSCDAPIVRPAPVLPEQSPPGLAQPKTGVIGDQEMRKLATAIADDPVRRKNKAFELLKSLKPDDGTPITYAGPDPGQDEAARLLFEVAKKYGFPLSSAIADQPEPNTVNRPQGIPP